MRKVLIGVAVVVVSVVGLAACSPLKTINVFTPSDTYRLTEDVAYGESPRQRLDVYTPINAQGPSPVVVFFYGGSWTGGSRTDYKFVGEALAARGIVTVVADYRLSPEVVYPAFVQDSAQAVAWAVRNIAKEGGDPSHLFVMGHSAGGYNAAMVALDKRWLGEQGLTQSAVRGWIGLAGPYDFIPIENPDIKPAFLYPNTPPESQPINHVTASSPPALLLAGSDDDIVEPRRNTLQLAELLRKQGVPVQAQVFNGISHPMMIGVVWKPLRGRAPVLDRVVDFVHERQPGVQASTGK
ncbi:MAG: alpha/beta hydrolase [Comamonadaceae bacterium]|nr:MAG: alpha/beta hydrolase [Comamonadaceae bacterium]